MNANKSRRLLGVACKWAIYGAIIGAIAGSWIGCATVRTETYDLECHGAYGSGCMRPMTTSEKEKEGEARFFGGALVGGLLGASVAALPLTVSIWYLFLVMLGQVSDAARTSKPARHNVRVRFDSEDEE